MIPTTLRFAVVAHRPLAQLADHRFDEPLRSLDTPVGLEC